MIEFVLLLAVLICPLVMGGMMLVMWRSMSRGKRDEPPNEDGPE